MRDLIVWLEDRPDSVSQQVAFCKRLGFEVKVVGSAHRFAELLLKDRERIALIILDVMLFQLKSLADIGIENSDTAEGYHAGWVVVDRFLRPELEGGEAGYPDLPILILSSRRLFDDDLTRLESLRLRGGQWIEYIEKVPLAGPEMQTWSQRFEGVVGRIPPPPLRS